MFLFYFIFNGKRFARRAKNVQNKPEVNEVDDAVPIEFKKMKNAVSSLEAEVEAKKAEIEANHANIERLQNELKMAKIILPVRMHEEKNHRWSYGGSSGAGHSMIPSFMADIKENGKTLNGNWDCGFPNSEEDNNEDEFKEHSVSLFHLQ